MKSPRRNAGMAEDRRRPDRTAVALFIKRRATSRGAECQRERVPGKRAGTARRNAEAERKKRRRIRTKKTKVNMQEAVAQRAAFAFVYLNLTTGGAASWSYQ
jgi:hypothetical protein